MQKAYIAAFKYQAKLSSNKLIAAFAIFMFGETISAGFLVHASRATARAGKEEEEHVSFASATALNIVRPRHRNTVPSIP